MNRLRCYAVDDEELPLATLVRLLRRRPEVEVAGWQCDPVAAKDQIDELRPDALFLDIHMPEWDGFALLARLEHRPQVVFLTAYEQYAVQAFEVNSVDYLLKPVSDAALDRALARLTASSGASRETAWEIARQVLEALQGKLWRERVAIRKGEFVTLLPVQEVACFVAEARATYAWTPGGKHLLDQSLAELEAELDPRLFFRVHRAAIVRLEAVLRLSRWIGGKLFLELAGLPGVRVTVSRERAEPLRRALGIAN